MGQVPNSRLLLVEGKNDSRVICELFEKATGISWETGKKQYLVEIEDCNNDTGVLNQVRVRWKESGRKMIGVVIDADADADARWLKVRNSSPPELLTLLPEKLPRDPVVIDGTGGKRFGVWIMPNNDLPGMLETFLANLRTSMPHAVGEHIVSSMNIAKNLLDGHAATNPDARPRVSSWKEVHKSKAEIHTWLAWRDPPGEQLHEAVRHESLDVHAPLARAFVQWMRRLYEL
jgi:hypothetical protein